MKTELKKVFKITSDVLLYLTSILLVVTLWLENNIIASASICMSLIAIVLLIISIEKFDVKKIFSDINVYYFIVLIVLGISRIIGSDILFRVGLVLFVVLILVYFGIIFLKKGVKKGEKKSK